MKRLLTLAALLVSGFSSLNASAGDPVYLKNFREIYSSYASATGIDARDPELREIYRLNVDRLPPTGLPSELKSDVVLATTELGGAFCKRAINQEKTLPRGQRLVFGLIDFARGPSQFTSYLKEALSDHLAQLFWQRNVLVDETAAIGTLIEKAARGQPDTAAETEQILHVVCTTYATSLAFLAK